MNCEVKSADIINTSQTNTFTNSVKVGNQLKCMKFELGYTNNIAEVPARCCGLKYKLLGPVVHCTSRSQQYQNLLAFWSL